jgi:DNA-directed RNA polymerase subunit M/transcription elongation factor TFIIS
MIDTLILACNKCGGLLLAKADTKTRTCPYCGATIKTDKAKKVGSAPTAQEASTLLKKLKASKQPE